ncbi:MAG TPA: sialate O-acetylesterase, partial [Puia sp.]|nr:sialate O-acetylesterase [Puia sp.]
PGARGQQGAIYINQYIPSSVKIGKVGVRMETSYPEEGRVVIHVDGEGSFPLYVRIPAWCVRAGVMVNGVALKGVVPGKYVRIEWKKGDVITLNLPMELHWVRHDHYMKTSDRKPYKTVADADAPYALVRGPVVYVLDDIWYKGDTADFSKGWMDTARYVLDDPSGMRPLPAPGKDMLGPGYTVRVELPGGKRVEAPVYPFANIGKWYRDAAHKPDSNAATWGYAIWLKGENATGAIGGASGGTTEGSADGPVERVGSLAVPKIFGDNMVLQRGVAAPVWGMAEPGAEVTVQFGKQEKKARADTHGNWRIMLDALTASAEPAAMVIAAGKDMISFRNVLVGEVWLCGGQSNMEYSMRKNSKFEKAAHGSGPANELERADNPAIRIFLVGHNYSKPGKDIRRKWDTAAGAPLREFSAAGYFFAKEIYAQLGVPVGVISTAIPGSAIEPFLPDSGKFYQAMIRPLAPYAVKGFLWYQGETNCFMNDTVRYAGKMKELIESWRSLWGGPELSFYFVQIAPFLYSHSSGGNQPHAPTTEAAFWAEQEQALAIPHTGMVVTTDLVDSLTELHPPYKWEIGHRLALLALGRDYGKAVEWSGPVYKRLEVRGDKIELNFSHGGLVSRDGKPLDWFEVAGKDGRFVPAKAVISDDKVIVSGVKKPVAVRFGWNEGAQPNLYNKAGLPAMPFTAAINGE